MNNTHLIWFNGTDESLKNSEHLFEKINKDDYSVVPGWGTDGFHGISIFKVAHALEIFS